MAVYDVQCPIIPVKKYFFSVNINFIESCEFI